MALTESLPVYRDVYKLIRLLFDYSRNFSREYKYTLGQDIKRDSITLVRSIYRANRSMAKTEYLEEFLDNFEILKLEIRLCVDMRLFSPGQQAQLALLMEQVGKQVTGWKKSSERT